MIVIDAMVSALCYTLCIQVLFRSLVAVVAARVTNEGCETTSIPFNLH